MRLGQLARKLSLRPQQIVDFLASHQIVIDDDSNARLNDDHVDMLVRQFAPLNTEKEVFLGNEEAALPLEGPQGIEAELRNETTDADLGSEHAPTETNVEEAQQEVIKAPKIELQGLKVLGKIELPESKKKTEPEVSKPDVNEVPETKRRSANDDRRPQSSRKPRTENRGEKNPIALAREREAQDAKRKREEAAERAKEQRAKNYQKKVKVSPPTRRAKLIDEQVEEFSASDSKPAPKGFWGKIKQWFKS